MSGTTTSAPLNSLRETPEEWRQAYDDARWLVGLAELTILGGS